MGYQNLTALVSVFVFIQFRNSSLPCSFSSSEKTTMSAFLKGVMDRPAVLTVEADPSSLAPFTLFTEAHVADMSCQQCHTCIRRPRSSWPLGVNIKCCDLEDAVALWVY